MGWIKIVPEGTEGSVPSSHQRWKSVEEKGRIKKESSMLEKELQDK